MSEPVAAGAQLRPHRRWLLALVAVLMLVLLAIGYVQWRQYKLLTSASYDGHEALGWSFSQLETEQLRLVNQMQLYLDDPQHHGADTVQLRYDIFVSRIGVVDHDRAAAIVRHQPAYLPAIAQVRSFVNLADRYFGESPAQPLDAVAAQTLLGPLRALNAPLHDLSLGASHLLYQHATERNLAVRQQSRLSIGLTAFQCVLLMALAFIVLRQLRALTERRRNLEALADNLSAARRGAETANRAKSAFLANMSHEIRTPFHGLLGMMSLLQDSPLSPQQAGYLDTARESAQHLLTILNDLLDISRLESGKLQVVPQSVDLLQLIAQVDALMAVQARGKGLVLRVEVAPDVPRSVHADPTRLKQILFNLLSNAVKFTNIGTVVLSVTTGDSGRLDFSVTDSGVGIDEATLGRLFQRFVQGDESPSRRAGGAGLGLEISRDLARLMGGDITVHSQPGAGSSFTASLPLPSVGTPALVSNDSVAPNAARARPLRVLVAEDHPVNRAYMEAVLEKLGHHAVFKADGNGAVRAIAEQPPLEPFDIVLMDLHMPGMDGFTAARAIRALPAPRGRVPIIALTADAFQESRHLAREAGMDGYLTKPAHLPQLREALERYGGATARPPPAPNLASLLDVDDSLLDRDTVVAVRQAVSPDTYAELLGGLLEGWSHVLGELRQAASAHRFDELRARTHALRGASLNLGLKRVGELAGELHAIVPGAPVAELTRLIDRLELQFRASVEECLRLGLLPDSGHHHDGFRPRAAPARA